MQPLSISEVIIRSLQTTLQNVLPIIMVIAFFQIIVLRKKIPNLRQITVGSICVILGLSIFLVGLEEGIFPLGIQMANQLSDKSFVSGGMSVPREIVPSDYFWIYAFSFLIGFSTALAEPSLIAVAMKAQEISVGAISPWGLRLAVALGAAIGISLGTYRIIIGAPLYIYIIAGYVFLLVQTWFAPKALVPLAYDCGGVTTSTVTVPLVAALGIGLSSNVPDRSPLIDGFGLIASTALFPMITVLGYAMITPWLRGRETNR